MELFDLIIVGAGPAGMTASVYASRSGLNVLLLDQMPGGKMVLTSDVENYPGRSRIAGQELADEMYRHSIAFGARHEMAVARQIRPGQGIHEVETADAKVYRTKAVIIASGTVERKLGIPGENDYYGMGVSYCAVCDGAFFRNKPVVVIGGGSTAFEDALYLTKFAASVKLILRRDVARAEKVLQDRVAANPKIERMHFWTPQEIRGNGMNITSLVIRERSTGEVREIETSAVFPMIGVDANTAFIKNLNITDENGFILANDMMETSIPGIFAAGDVREKKLRQIVTATSDGAIAAEAVNHYLDSWAMPENLSEAAAEMETIAVN